jgi:hypothetical protein
LDAPQCLGLQLLTDIPAETTSKWNAKYRYLGPVRFHALQLLPARFINVSVQPGTYIDRISKPACLFLYDHGYPAMFGIDQTEEHKNETMRLLPRLAHLPRLV